jgi:hypothetical protein
MSKSGTSLNLEDVQVLEEAVSETSHPVAGVALEHGFQPEPDSAQNPEWTPWQRIFFRIGFLFIAQLLLPLQRGWYQHLASVRSLKAFYSLSGGLGLRYLTLKSESGRWGIGSFVSWGIALLVAIVGAAIWTWFARNSSRKEYNALYYWTRLLVRYWVALSILHFGYLKVWPRQMPFPSISNLHTLLGETATYRLYWASVGFVTWYQVVLGVLEVTAGSLLFFRAATALGAVLNLGVLYNIAHANFAYDGGVHTLSAEISLLSGFLLLQYVPDLWRLLIKKESVQPHYYRPVFRRAWKRRAFLGAKIAAWILFIPCFAYATHDAFSNSNLSKEPRGPGLVGAKGYYNVTEFRLNDKVLPYSPLDPVRWHDVVFEDYPTLVYKVNRAFSLQLGNGSPAYKDVEKRYELSGFAGGRRYLHYEVDEAHQLLYLEDKNQGSEFGDLDREVGRSGKTKAKPIPKPVKLVWHYSRPSDSRIILSGPDDKGNSLYVVLDRIEEKYPIQIGSPLPGQPLHYDRTFTRRYPVTDRSFDSKGDGGDCGRACM